MEGNDDDGRIHYTCPNCGEENFVDVLEMEGSAMQVECKICGVSMLIVKRFDDAYKIFRLKIQIDLDRS